MGIREKITQIVDSVSFDPSYGEFGKDKIPKAVDAILAAVRDGLPEEELAKKGCPHNKDWISGFNACLSQITETLK